MTSQPRLPAPDKHDNDLDDDVAQDESPVSEIMLRDPKTLTAETSLAQAEAALLDDHVHMVLLTDGTKLVGTLTRSDLPPPGTPGQALPWSTLEGRTVAPDVPLRVVRQLLSDQGVRRMAVVDADGSLVGLMCLKRHRTGFCSQDDVASRARERRAVLDDPAEADPRATYDALRSKCPVAVGADGWMLLRHAEVLAAATDPGTFSSRVTARRAIPNALDGADHAVYRAVVERYLTAERVALQEEPCRAHAVAVVDALPRGSTVEVVAGVGIPYAVRSQSSWLGWPADLEDELVGWIDANHAAARSGSAEQNVEVAASFDQMIRGLLKTRRDRPSNDVTGELMNDTVDGRPLSDEEIVSILRNWTAGDLGSLATSVGVVLGFLTANPPVQQQLRDLVEAADSESLEAAVEEILRIDDPFVSNRRVSTREVAIGGERIPKGARVLLNWTAANRDPLVFGDPDRFDPVANADSNLVFGAGPHSCPARALTLMELRVVLEEILRGTAWIDPSPDENAARETLPMGGWSRVPVVLR